MEPAEAARYQAYWARQAAVEDMQVFRSELGGIPARGGQLPDGGVLSRLDTGGSSFYGVNAHGQPRLVGSALNWTHAEIDALQQAFMAGRLAPRATMYVDTALCQWCRRIDGLPQALQDLQMKELVVHDPFNSWRITPAGVEQIPWKLR